MTTLSTQLASGEKSTSYAGMGVNEGFAIAARSQLASISAFTDTMTNVNTMISAANNALQSLSSIGGQVQNSAAETPATLDSTGQTIAQQNASAELASMVGILNTPAGDRYLFSGTAIGTPATVPVDQMHQWHHDPGRIENGHRRTRAGRWHHRHRASGDLESDRDADGGVGSGRRRRFTVRPEIEHRIVVADRCHRDRAFRLAGRRFRSRSAPPIPTPAIR